MPLPILFLRPFIECAVAWGIARDTVAFVFPKWLIMLITIEHLCVFHVVLPSDKGKITSWEEISQSVSGKVSSLFSPSEKNNFYTQPLSHLLQHQMLLALPIWIYRTITHTPSPFLWSQENFLCISVREEKEKSPRKIVWQLNAEFK